MRVRTCLFITALMLCHLPLWPQTLTKQFPSASGPSSLPDAPDYPIAEVVAAPPSGVPVRVEARQQEKHGDVFLLTGDVRIEYKDFVLTADKASYDQETGDAEADGHVRLEGAKNNELILADHGKLNFDLETGRFENVTGSIGRRPSASKRKLVYTTDNPFLFSARVLIKEGPERYQLIHGTMTSCLLPDPDWQIHSALIRVNYGVAQAKNSYFALLGVPILPLPYVTHPVSVNTRESGLLLPELGTSSTKGTIVGDSIYLVINRSADATLGVQYWSKRGWSPSGNFRYRGRGEDFVNARFTALWDRGLYQAPYFLNQGGQDIVLSGRRDFDLDEHTRAVATAEYLSSYVYRQEFAESFAQAVANQVTSSVFITHNDAGRSISLHFDRYQNFEGITQVGDTYDTPEIRILHVPSLDFDSIGQSVPQTPLSWQVDAAAAGLSRSEPGYQTGTLGRLDLYPHLSLPMHFDGWTLRPEVAARETYYSESQIPTSTTPLPGSGSVNRSDLEASFELRPPVLVRDFKVPALERLFGSDLRHTIEPELQYHFVGGINNFPSIPRFDAVDVASDTNELGFSLTQRLLFKHLHPKPCRSGDVPAAVNGAITLPYDYTECGGNTDAWITWKLAAKYFFEPYFGGAVSPFRRNVITSSLDLTGVAFINGPLNTSPVISRVQVRTSEHMDLEWDADYDFKSRRLDVSNLFIDYRRAGLFGSLGYSILQTLNASFTANLASQVTKYNQVRMLLGYGSPTKRGLSVAGDAGYDLVGDVLQYGGVQASYNWDCCGLAFEYRRLEVGVTNENEKYFSFTLAGVGSAGSLKHSERIF